MPVLKWQTREAEEASKPSQRPLQNSHGEGRVLQHARVGEPLTKGAPVNQQGENHAPAAHYNGYAEYVPPATESMSRPAKREKRCWAKGDTCMGWATSTGYCRPHSVGDE